MKLWLVSKRKQLVYLNNFFLGRWFWTGILLTFIRVLRLLVAAVSPDGHLSMARNTGSPRSVLWLRQALDTRLLWDAISARSDILDRNVVSSWWLVIVVEVMLGWLTGVWWWRSLAVVDGRPLRIFAVDHLVNTVSHLLRT